MNKVFLLSVGFFAFAVLAAEARPDGTEVNVTDLIGDISNKPDWFQQLVSRSAERAGEGRGMVLPRLLQGLFQPADEDITNINPPQWYLDFGENVYESRLFKEESESIVFEADVPDWFQAWFLEILDTLKEIRENRNDQRTGGPGNRRGDRCRGDSGGRRGRGCRSGGGGGQGGVGRGRGNSRDRGRGGGGARGDPRGVGGDGGEGGRGGGGGGKGRRGDGTGNVGGRGTGGGGRGGRGDGTGDVGGRGAGGSDRGGRGRRNDGGRDRGGG